jgi:hypothetical protein
MFRKSLAPHVDAAFFKFLESELSNTTTDLSQVWCYQHHSV